MKICLLTQGSQGLLALRNLFAAGYIPDDIRVIICNVNQSKPLVEFLKFNKMDFQIAEHKGDLQLPTDASSAYLVSVSWKFLIPSSFFSKFIRSVNLHPGLLPNYKGCFSTSWSLINGERECGYTFHEISDRFDEGKILFKKSFDILDSDTAFSLNYKLMNDALDYLPKLLTGIDELIGEANVGGKYFKNLLPYNGQLPPDWSGEMKNRFIRAMYFPPFEGAYEIKNGKKYYLELSDGK